MYCHIISLPHARILKMPDLYFSSLMYKYYTTFNVFTAYYYFFWIWFQSAYKYPLKKNCQLYNISSFFTSKNYFSVIYAVVLSFPS